MLVQKRSYTNQKVIVKIQNAFKEQRQFLLPQTSYTTIHQHGATEESVWGSKAIRKASMAVPVVANLQSQLKQRKVPLLVCIACLSVSFMLSLCVHDCEYYAFYVCEVFVGTFMFEWYLLPLAHECSFTDFDDMTGVVVAVHAVASRSYLFAPHDLPFQH